MTGFARVRRGSCLGDLVVSLRSVNHRALDLHFHTPPDLEPYEPAIRKLISGAVVRGHIDIRIHLARSNGESHARFNPAMLAAWVVAFREAARAHGLSGEPDLNTASRIPGMLADAPGNDPPAEFEAELLGAVGEALTALNTERGREGGDTAKTMLGYAESIRGRAEEIEEIRADAVRLLQLRLEERLREMLGATIIDPARLAQEAAMLADRSDIAEETTRLRIHTGQVIELLQKGGETGKKLEFLIQELQREATTILSKANGAGEPGRKVTSLGLAIKSAIEKLREQSSNIE